MDKYPPITNWLILRTILGLALAWATYRDIQAVWKAGTIAGVRKFNTEYNESYDRGFNDGARMSRVVDGKSTDVHSESTTLN